MPYNIILYFRLLCFHVANCALFSTYYFSTLILYRRSLDTFYLTSQSEATSGGDPNYFFNQNEINTKDSLTGANHLYTFENVFMQHSRSGLLDACVIIHTTDDNRRGQITDAVTWH